VALEFAQDVADVALGGERTDHEPAGDLVVIQAAGDQPEDLEFAVGQLGESRERLPRIRARGELGDQPPGDPRR
jgi:hypothetical protein